MDHLEVLREKITRLRSFPALDVFAGKHATVPQKDVRVNVSLAFEELLPSRLALTCVRFPPSVDEKSGLRSKLLDGHAIA